jgi:hypothetical protein
MTEKRDRVVHVGQLNIEHKLMKHPHVNVQH